MQRKVEVSYPPERIISLVPSQTELLYDLGLGDRLVGQTLFCIHPDEMFRVKPRVGGTKKLNMEKIHELSPDLIIGNKEENDQAQIAELMQHYPVWMSDIRNVDEALDMIGLVGELTDTIVKASEIITSVRLAFGALTPLNRVKAAYFIWRKPYMVAGKNTFIHDMMNKIGLENVFAQETSRYPEVTMEQLKHSGAEWLLLSSEPYPFDERHVDELREAGAKVMLVDGEMFSWYGSRMLNAAGYLDKLSCALRNG